MHKFIDDPKRIMEMEMKAKKMMILYAPEIEIKRFEEALNFAFNS
jgi:hypothetical protein